MASKIKKIDVSLLCDEFHTADCLRELASFIEEENIEITESPLELTGDHYTAEVKLIYC